MEVILIKDVDKLGDANQVIKVKDGYGRNYLIPAGLALVANDGNRNMLKERVKQSDAREKKMIEKVQKVIDQLQNTTIKVGAKVGQSEKIFGSITNVQLADAIKKQVGVEIDRKKIIIADEIKTLGSYKAEINLKSDMKVSVNFEVVEE